MNELLSSTWESDVDNLMFAHDDTSVPLPDIEFQPQRLISKVRKHYMQYLIKLLSINYETNQRLINKNIYLPSAIWRCAKNIEMSAAQACMVVEIYRKNVIAAINKMKHDTKHGKLFKSLYHCLNQAPSNEKKTQTMSFDKFTDCNCSKRKRRRSSTPIIPQYNEVPPPLEQQSDSTFGNFKDYSEQFKIPVAINLHADDPQPVSRPNTTQNISSTFVQSNYVFSPKPIDSQDPDELMMQLEKLFHEENNVDDLFGGALCESMDVTVFNETQKIESQSQITINYSENFNATSFVPAITENQIAQTSCDERMAAMAGEFVQKDTNVINNTVKEHDIQKRKSSKWLCEEYFQKVRLYNLLDNIRESNRKDFLRIKEIFVGLFGESEEEGVVSPLNESTEFIKSCKERIAPWVVKQLTPYYVKGYIDGKSLFKSLAKHLIRLIYQCSCYPQEYEVQSFLLDFLHNHKTIRCEADFEQFKIDNYSLKWYQANIFKHYL